MLRGTQQGMFRLKPEILVSLMWPSFNLDGLSIISCKCCVFKSSFNEI